MKNIKLKSFNISNRGAVDITVTIFDDLYYGYGYGYTGGIIDFFNIFGLSGNCVGSIFTDIISVQGLPNYSYGYGYEYSNVIAGNNRNKRVDVLVEPQFDIDPSEEFVVSIDIIGPGVVDEKTKTTVGRVATFFVTDLELSSISESNNLRTSFTTTEKNLNNQKTEKQSFGGSVTYDKDSYFDMIISVSDTSQNFPTIKLVSSIKNYDFYSKDIKMRSRI